MTLCEVLKNEILTAVKMSVVAIRVVTPSLLALLEERSAERHKNISVTVHKATVDTNYCSFLNSEE
jgi:hypothetical protein